MELLRMLALLAGCVGLLRHEDGVDNADVEGEEDVDVDNNVDNVDNK